jgi:hypothetical protein
LARDKLLYPARNIKRTDTSLLSRSCWSNRWSRINISEHVRNWVNSRRHGIELEIKQLNADSANSTQVVRIEGGLPDLPGTNIIMPEPNTSPVIESTPALEPT